MQLNIKALGMAFGFLWAKHWLAPTGIDQGILYEGNSTLRGRPRFPDGQRCIGTS